MRRIGSIAGRLAGTLLILLLLLSVISLFLPDEDPTPEARALLEWSAPVEGNAFVALLGFDAAADRDFVEEGKARFERIRKLSGPDADAVMSDLRKRAELKFSGEFSVCSVEVGSRECVEAVSANAQHLRELAAGNQVLLQRYRILRQTPAYRSEHCAVAPYAGLVRSSRLLGALATLDIMEGRVERGLAAFAEDFAFLHRILASENLCLIDSLLAAAMMRFHLKQLSGLIEQGDYFSEEHAAKARELLAPVFDPARTFAVAIQGEAREIMRIGDIFPDVDAKKNLSQLMWMCCYRKQMTVNLLASVFVRMAESALALPPERVRAEYGDIVALSKTAHPVLFWRSNLPEQPFRFFFWKNIIGEILLGTTRSDCSGYLLRFYDNAAYQRYVRAQLEYRLAREGKENPGKLLQSLGKETFDPYTGKPFAWDGKTGKLRFEPAYRRPGRADVFKDVEVVLH
jgi:hypothetical protein